MIHRLLLLLALSLAGGVQAAETPRNPPRIFLIGDSTMANKPLELPERGWGMALPALLQEGVKVENHAVNGRSTKSFIDEERWDQVRAALEPGDWLIIQFGHNDEKQEDPRRYADPATTYRDNLRRFVREARARGATPLLATPVCRRKFDAAGTLVDTHGAYPDAVRAVAMAERVPLLDLERATAAWLQAAGPEASKAFFMWIAPGAHPKLLEGKQDDTHFVAAGAEHVARLAVEEIRRLHLPLVDWLK